MKTINVEDRRVVEKIIGQCRECFVGIIDKNGLPYVVPMCFGYDEGVLYLHSAPEGFLIESVEQNPVVCITFSTSSSLVYQHPDVACSYRLRASSVVCRGRVVFVEDENLEEKRRILDVLMKQYSDKIFTYSDPALRNVRVWKVKVVDFSCRKFAISRSGSNDD
jgi:nitroimidazol reductase NimA-like FMN-containing flavoprotein (pyridoxamine 5'-phosphate oxidase superfamily)